MTVECRRLTDRERVLAGVERWNDAHPEFEIDERLVEQNVYAPFAGVDVAAWGWYADADESVPTGFVLAKTLTRTVHGYAGPDRGWISLLAVDSGADDFRAVGRALLDAAERELANSGVETLRFGGDPQNFLAGLPGSFSDDYADLLADAGYERDGTVYDLERDISGFELPERVERTRALADDLTVERVEARSESDLTRFLEREFPGRWHYEAENVARRPGGVDDYWVLRRGETVVGFARTNAPSSAYCGPNANWGWRLGDAYCGLGPVGIHSEYRGRGWGLFLLATVVESLRDDGYDHVVIDWTGLLDYYAKLGFEPWLEYDVFRKDL
ncbi:GNAT family N-acetyltransferase [Halorussus amylolyticus]|uniref:GNAT family N-acetyltransferase n=1 Tax=Halorussus amylolyticus TaxID=1126242 RepID=UPI00104590D4|nr:GNAT family N-acetyltransferase [Halorussus amylolyticus]